MTSTLTLCDDAVLDSVGAPSRMPGRSIATAGGSAEGPARGWPGRLSRACPIKLPPDDDACRDIRPSGPLGAVLGMPVARGDGSGECGRPKPFMTGVAIDASMLRRWLIVATLACRSWPGTIGTGGRGAATRSGDDHGQKLVEPARLIGTGGESGVRAGVRSGVAWTDSVERSDDWRLTEDESVVERDDGVRCMGDDVDDETISTCGGECGGSWIDMGPFARRLVERPSPFDDVASAGMSLARRSSRAMQCPSSDAPDASTFGGAATPGDADAADIAWPAPSMPEASMTAPTGRRPVVWPPRACVARSVGGLRVASPFAILRVQGSSRQHGCARLRLASRASRDPAKWRRRVLKAL